MSSADVSPMTPKPEDTSIFIPVSFDSKGTKREQNRTTYVIAVSVALISIIISFFILKGGFSIVNLLRAAFVLTVAMYIIRFPILKEHHYRKSITSLQTIDYNLNAPDFWGIVDIEPNYPFLVRYKNGMIALFVHFEPDVIVGKGSNAEHNHFVAQSDAFKLAASFNISIYHIDLMDVIGRDTRLDDYITSVSEFKNEDVRDLLLAMSVDQKTHMSEAVSASDYFVFIGRGLEKNFISGVYEVVEAFMAANYSSWNFLNASAIRELAMSLFNLHDFSLTITSREAFASEKKFIKAISLQNQFGEVEKLNPTQQEIKKIEAQKEAEKKAAKEGRRAKTKSPENAPYPKRSKSQGKKGLFSSSKKKQTTLDEEPIDLF